jgi:hypothetical protein
MRSVGFALFKAAVFGLLAWNTAVYVYSGTLSEGLDSAAWLTLLVLFELETGFGDRFREGGTATAIRAARLVAAAAVCAAAAGYVREKEWLDAINTGFWIVLVALFECQVRYREAAARHRAWFAGATAMLYAGLAVLVLAWAWRGEWFDAYDALLWLTALLIIEINILRGLRRDAHSPT